MRVRDRGFIRSAARRRRKFSELLLSAVHHRLDRGVWRLAVPVHPLAFPLHSYRSARERSICSPIGHRTAAALRGGVLSLRIQRSHRSLRSRHRPNQILLLGSLASLRRPDRRKGVIFFFYRRLEFAKLYRNPAAGRFPKAALQPRKSSRSGIGEQAAAAALLDVYLLYKTKTRPPTKSNNRDGLARARHSAAVVRGEAARRLCPRTRDRTTPPYLAQPQGPHGRSVALGRRGQSPTSSFSWTLTF